MQSLIIDDNNVTIIYKDNHYLIFSYKNNIIDNVLINQVNLNIEYYEIVISLKNKSYSFKKYIYGFNRLKKYIKIHLDYYIP